MRPSVLSAFLVLFLSVACGNVAGVAEQPALPAAPVYPSTAADAPLPADAPIFELPTLPAFAAGRAVPAEPTAAPRHVPTLTHAPSVLAGPSDTADPVERPTPAHDLAALSEYQRGIAFVGTNRDEYASDASRRALDELFATGANYISLLVTWYQYDAASTVIAPASNTPSDGDLASVIEYAHAHGVKVLLKPQVNFTADPDHWRGEIEFNNEADWHAWFASYREFILHYARFAQAHVVEEFSVGTELFATTRRVADWRAVIRAVRAEYTGLLTYSANHSGEEVQVSFWNALDFIGVNVFYHISNYRTPTLAQILRGWELPVRQLNNLHNRYPAQPIIFTEVGYPSMDLAGVWPWNWQRNAPVDLQEQALLYQGLFQTWWHNPARPWFRGMFIWNWLPDPDQGGPADSDYTPHGKPAEQILRAYYLSEP